MSINDLLLLNMPVRAIRVSSTGTWPLGFQRAESESGPRRL